MVNVLSEHTKRRKMVAYVLAHPELDEPGWWGQVTFHLGDMEVKAQIVEAPRKVVIEDLTKPTP